MKGLEYVENKVSSSMSEFINKNIFLIFFQPIL